MKLPYPRLVFLACLALSATFSAIGCTHPSYETLEPGTLPSGGVNPTGTPSPDPSHCTSCALKKAKPVLAMRAMNCTICHAQVDANIVTDFGYGGNGVESDYFLGGSHATAENPARTGYVMPLWGNFLNSWQGDHETRPGSWLNTRISGTVIVPKAQISNPNVLQSLGRTGPISLLEMMQSTYATTDSSNSSILGATQPPPGLPRAKEISSIYIGAPTRAEIQALAPQAGSDPSHPWQFFPDDASAPALSGLELAGSGSSTFVRNTSQRLICHGDLVIQGTLHLKNVEIDSGNLGCRIYVTDSVFIEGPIARTSSSGTENLQITSSRGILIGMAIQSTGSSDTAVNFLDTFYGLKPNFTPSQPSYLRDFGFTRGPGTVTEKAANIARDGLKVGTLKDCVDGSGNRLSIDYDRLLLNAPQIHNRCHGRFKGSVIAEFGVLSIGTLNFQYDEVFEKVPSLPLLQKSGVPVLVIGE